MDQPVQTSELDAQTPKDQSDLYIVAGADQAEAYANDHGKPNAVNVQPEKSAEQLIAEILADSDLIDHIYRAGTWHA